MNRAAAATARFARPAQSTFCRNVASTVPSAKMTVDLTGSVACVTGAAQGLGRAVADRLHSFGANVVFSDQNISKLEELKCNVQHPRARVVQCDVSDPASVESMYDLAVKDFG